MTPLSPRASVRRSRKSFERHGEYFLINMQQARIRWTLQGRRRSRMMAFGFEIDPTHPVVTFNSGSVTTLTTFPPAVAK